MHLVSFSTDRKILTEGSVLQSAYATQCASYTVYVLSRVALVPHERSLGEKGKAILFRLPTLCTLSFWRTLIRANVISVQDPFETGYVGLFFSYMFRKPLHVQIHTDIFSPHFTRVHPANSRRQRWALFIVHRAKRVRVVSRHIRDVLIERGVHCPITVLPIFVDVPRFAHIQHQAHVDYTYHFVAIGRLEPEKQFAEAIRALALVRAKGYHAGLTIAGAGSAHAELVSVAKECGVFDQVTFTGALTDVAPLLGQASALLLPSAYEGYGLVVIEALAAQVPVIAYDVGIAKEMGAVIAPGHMFPETVLAWVQEPTPGALVSYPYKDREQYVRAWIQDVQACV